MITVVTAAYGNYDVPHLFPDHPDLSGTVVTDHHDTGYAFSDAGWDHVTIQPLPHVHPRMAAKVPKCDPWRFVFSGHTDTIVWLDASARIKDAEAFIDAVRSVPATQAIGQFVHPDRDDVIDEAFVSETMPKYKGQDVVTQAKLYERRGLPAHWGLWATGMIVYHPAVFDLYQFGNAWLVEQLAWTYQDQISEPWLLWKATYRPFSLPGHLRSNDYVEWMPHTRDD
jgi:hypothetical protein